MSRSALILECPLCGAEADHPTKRTKRKYLFPAFLHPAIYVHIGQADPGYRVRVKVCKGCGEEFESVEMSKKYFARIVAEFEEGREREKKLRQLVEQADEILGVTRRKRALRRMSTSSKKRRKSE